MDKKVTVTKSSTGILDILQIVLIVLKLCKVEPIASWSWPVVLIPLWIGLGIFVIALIVMLILFFKR